MDWPMLWKAAAITVGGVLGMVGFVFLVDKYPNVGGVILVGGLLAMLTILVYRIIGGTF